MAVSALPTGVVTLWFADVEGSTALVHRLGDGDRPPIEQVRSLLRAAVAAGGGHEVDCRGDELFVVFTSPDAAATAAVAAQHALADADWPEGVRPRVRIGIHTGGPSIADRTYFGVDVHVAVRVCSVGHGGQILLSGEAAAALARPGEMRDLGVHDLRGLPDPQRLHQLVAPGLALDFPALRMNRDLAVEAERTGVRVVLAEDSVLLREGIARLLEDGGFEIVGQAGNADELLLKVRSYSPDVAIVDIRMPPTHTDEGLRAAQEIREKHPGTGVLVLSQYVETEYAMELLADSAEGVGYLLKDRVSDVDEFVDAVRRVGGRGAGGGRGGFGARPVDRAPARRPPAPRRPARRADAARAPGARADGRGQVEQGHRREARRHRARGREARDEHLRKAASGGVVGRPSPRPRGARAPARRIAAAAHRQPPTGDRQGESCWPHPRTPASRMCAKAAERDAPPMHSATTTTEETEMTELAHRINDGVSVSLLWNRHSNELTVAVDDSRTGEAFEVDAPNDRAMDVFHHPYAYAAAQRNDIFDRIAERGPIYA